ncbi:hypothetical protein AB0L06_09935 [Spirillospora sp. NPDC052269]
MAKIVDYGAFAERLKAATNRWDLLREFQEEWGYAVKPGSSRWTRRPEAEHEKDVLGPSGDTDTEDAERALPIPATLDEWWELPFNSFTHNPRLYWAHLVYPPSAASEPDGDGHLGPIPDDSDLVAPDADHRVCVFMSEYQACNEWGYPAADAHEPDPRVLVDVAVGEIEDGLDGEWVLQARSISEFFLQLAVQRLPRTLGWSTQIYEEDVVGDDDGAELVARIEAELPALGFEPWQELGQEGIVRGGPDVLVHLAKGVHGGIFLSGRTPQALLDLAARLGLERTEDDLEPPEEY